MWDPRSRYVRMCVCVCVCACMSALRLSTTHTNEAVKQVLFFQFLYITLAIDTSTVDGRSANYVNSLINLYKHILYTFVIKHICTYVNISQNFVYTYL